MNRQQSTLHPKKRMDYWQRGEQIDRAVRAALKEAARTGITSIHDMGHFQSVRSYQRLLRRNELTVRIYAAVPLPQWERLSTAGIMRGFGNEWLRLGAVAGFMTVPLGPRQL